MPMIAATCSVCRNSQPRYAGGLKASIPVHTPAPSDWGPGTQRSEESHPKEDPMAIDMEAMLAKIKDRQWALADIDWDAAGAEMITDEQRPQLKAFMADLCWLENIRARRVA